MTSVRTNRGDLLDKVLKAVFCTLALVVWGMFVAFVWRVTGMAGSMTEQIIGTLLAGGVSALFGVGSRLFNPFYPWPLYDRD